MRHKKALSLTGQPLHPDILKNREMKVIQEERSQREERSFFYKLSKQFSEASSHHFGGNPGRRIQTTHLKVRTKSSVVDGLNLTQLVDSSNPQTKLNTTNTDSDILNSTVRLDSNNLYGIMNRINAHSEVLDYPQELREPSKLVKVVQKIRRTRGGSIRDMKDKNSINSNTQNMPQSNIGKVNPTFHKSKKPHQTQNRDLLPFSALDIDPETRLVNKKKLIQGHNEATRSIEKDRENNKTIMSIKASTFRPLTSEPFHKRHIKMSRRGVPVFKFSDTKVSISMTL